MATTAGPPTASRGGVLHGPLRDEVADEIRNPIFTDRYKPADRLIEDQLAEEFAVSHDPNRAALRNRAAEDLIEVTARRDAVVAPRSPQTVEELLEARAAREAANARPAARRHDPAVLEHLNDILAQGTTAIEAGRIAQLAPLNTVFHAGLARAGHNRTLAELMRPLRDCALPLFRGQRRAFARETWADHGGILCAVIAADAELALLLGYRHVINAASRYGAGRLEPSRQRRIRVTRTVSPSADIPSCA